ncbi:GAF domain-containing protein [Halorussus litoreus]|uniref:GAF domain-containing protein n=1 Tax=Halorussus litoreus TaxID=1710536 RepID=UPI000E21F92F|nr:GAF domain-containing protein [Halorussus litoreus]
MTENRGSGTTPIVETLYIDDDPQLLSLTKDFLETQNPGIAVETTDSPQEGLSLVQSRNFDVVVCDYQMPEMDGLNVLETVRDEYDSDVPFIVFTGRGRKEVAIDALNLGADRYVRKGGDPTPQYGVLAQAIKQEVKHSRTQRKLQRREGNLQRVLESIGDAVITTDVDGAVTRMNEVAEDLTGWDADEARGQPLPEVFEILNQDTREPEESPARKVLESGEIVGLANGTILVRKDGSERYIADSASPIEGEDGEILGVVIVFRDVTESYRARTRQTRQRATIIDLSVDDDITAGNLERGARSITEAAAETLDTDRVGVWLFENDRTTLRNVDLYERSTDGHESGAELAADEYPEYFDALANNRVIDASDAQNDPRTGELRDGYLEPLDINSLLDATVRSGGEVVGVVCHEYVGERREWTDDERRFAGELADQVLRLLNNHEQKAHEEALAALHSIATEIPTFETPEAVCQRTIDAAETVLDFDLCVINFEEDGMLPIAAISENLPPDGATPMSVEEGIAGQTYRSGESFRFDDVQEVEVANPQGPYRAALSIPIGDHGVFQTVSEHVGAFDEDDRELAELLVSHAARALDQLESERELRQRNERLDEFTSIVSHDLRNPLNVAQGRLQLATEECTSPHLDDVAHALDRMAGLIEDLLAVARQGTHVTETASVDLSSTVERCWRNVDTADATLAVDTRRVIEADDRQIQQLLENLIRNAVDHGGEDVRVTVGDHENGFYVADDGPGIPENERGAVFEMGYSAAETGTGLGLSIVERVADSHGWDVRVVESEAAGARFEITGVTVEDE